MMAVGVMYFMMNSEQDRWIVQLPFQSNQEHWKKVGYKGLWIADKTLEGLVVTQSDFKDFVFENVIFKDCVFDTVGFQNSTFKNVIFDHVTFKHAYRPEGKEHLAADEDLSSVRLSNVQFQYCDFTNILMEDSILDRVIFRDSQFNHVNIDTLGGDIELIDSNGTELSFIAWGEANYQQVGGKFDTIVLERMQADFCNIEKAVIKHLQISGVVQESKIYKNHIGRFISEIDEGDLFVDSSQFQDVNLSFSKSKKSFFLNSIIKNNIQLYDSVLENLTLMDSQFSMLDIAGKGEIAHVELIRSPFQKVDVSNGRIEKLTLKQMSLPDEWSIGEKGHIDVLELKQPLFPKTFQYQGKPLPQCQVQIGAELQTYTNLPGQRLPEVLKKQVVLEGIGHVG